MDELLDPAGEVRVIVHPDVPGSASIARDLDGRLEEDQQVVLVVLPASQGSPDPVAQELSDRLGTDWVVAVASGQDVAALGPSLPKGEAQLLAEIAEDLSNDGHQGLRVFTEQLQRRYEDTITVVPEPVPATDAAPAGQGIPGGAVALVLVLVVLAVAGGVLAWLRRRNRPVAAPEWDSDRHDWSADELRAAMLSWPSEGLSAEVTRALDPVRRDMVEILSRWDEVRKNPDIAYDVSRTALDWVPSLLRLYAGLPGDLREAPVRGAGRTPTQAVLAQLEVLDRVLDDVRQAAYRGEVWALEAQSDFLAVRFHDSQIDLSGV